MTRAKYVIIDEVFPLVCSEATTHKELAGARNVTSAGFFRVVNGRVAVYGESTSTGKKSQPTDQRILERLLGLNGTMSVQPENSEYFKSIGCKPCPNCGGYTTSTSTTTGCCEYAVYRYLKRKFQPRWWPIWLH